MVLETNNLSIGYGRHIIRSGLELKIESPRMISLLGTNGTGKSTLLRTLADLQPPLEGSISVEGETKLTRAERARRISVVLTDIVRAEHMTVRELVAMGRIPYTSWTDRQSGHDDEMILESISRVNLSHKINSEVTELSDGELQRATIARALAQDTPIILLDEPTSHLDLPNRIEIMLLLRDLAEQQQKTIIISTHEVNLALQTSHEIWLLTRDNRLIAEPPDRIIANEAFISSFSSDKYEILSSGDYRLIK